MLKKFTSLLLVCAVILLSNTPQMAQTQNLSKETQSLQYSKVAETPKPNLKEIFANETLKLKTEKPFTEADAKKLEKESFNRQMKKNNFSTAAKIGIGVGVAAVVILVIVLATRDKDTSPSGPVQCGIRAPCP